MIKFSALPYLKDEGAPTPYEADAGTRSFARSKIELLPIPKGALFLISTGEYSDYSIDGVFRALDIIDTKSLRDEYLLLHPEQRQTYQFDDREFLAWLARKELLEPINTWEWHLSEYHCVEEMEVKKTT